MCEVNAQLLTLTLAPGTRDTDREIITGFIFVFWLRHFKILQKVTFYSTICKSTYLPKVEEKEG